MESENSLEEIGKRIKEYRKSQYNNYQDFAKACKLSREVICRLESGENFKMQTLIKALRLLNVSIEDFFKGIK
jgi:transcriptional regulator with XRE-family HTH domain